MSDASNSAIKSMIGETFLSLANALETGQFGKKYALVLQIEVLNMVQKLYLLAVL